jgi:hypothetical protein
MVNDFSGLLAVISAKSEITVSRELGVYGR